MKDPESNYAMQWPAKNYPKPDYLSSSRKRLAPQLIYKGGILNQWGKKMAVADHHELFKIANGLVGDFLITYDDAEEVRELARNYNFDMQTIAMKNTHHSTMQELLIGRNLDWIR